MRGGKKKKKLAAELFTSRRLEVVKCMFQFKFNFKSKKVHKLLLKSNFIAGIKMCVALLRPLQHAWNDIFSSCEIKFLKKTYI